MAADPERINAIIRAAVQVYRGTAGALLRLVTRLLRLGIDTPTWAADRMAGIGVLRMAVRGILRALRRDGPKEIEKAVVAGYRTGEASVVAELPKEVAAKLTAAAAKEQGVRVKRPAALDALVQGLLADFGAREQNIMRDVADAYRRVISEATSASIAGGITRREASQLAYARLVDRGLTGFTDRAGRRWRLDTYVEMAVRTVTQRAAVQGQVDKQARLGLPFIMISNTVQECSMCRPYEGRVLRIGPGPTGRITVAHQITGQPVEIEVTATLEAARAAGLFHPNCRHSARSYLPGVTKLPEQPTADPEGDAARQRQREIERHIRRWKERQIAALTPTAEAGARTRVRLWQARMRDHLAAHPALKRLPYREQIGAGNIPS